MRKISLMMAAFILTLGTMCHAQVQPSMRDMAVAQLYEYGQAVYDRGDFAEATQVFSRIIAMDPSHTGAYDYAIKLNQKGAHIALPAKPVAVPVKARESKQNKPGADLAVVPAVPMDPNADLKTDILQTSQTIDQLKKDILDLHLQIDASKKDLPVIH